MEWLFFPVLSTVQLVAADSGRGSSALDTATFVYTSSSKESINTKLTQAISHIRKGPITLLEYPAFHEGLGLDQKAS